MRTLSAELTAAQQATNNKPHVEIVLSSKDGATTETYKTDDATNRILRVRTAEGMYGGALFEVNLPSGKSVAIAAQIILNNSANTFTAKDYRGYRVKVRLGFESYWDGSSQVTITGTKFSEGEPFIVFAQRDNTREGSSITELWCISVWEALELLSIHGDSFGDTYKTTGSTLRQVMMSALCFESTQVWQFVSIGSVFNDRTVFSRPLDNQSGGYSWTMAAGDILYIGVDDSELNEFDRITIEQTLQGVGTWTAVYEYSKGAGVWGTLTDLVDNTNIGRDVHGDDAKPVPKVISFTHPSDWAANTVNAVSKRYIRIRTTISTTITTTPLITRIGVSKTWGFQIFNVDAFDALIKPEYQATLDTSRRDIFRDMLSMTQYAAVMTDTHMQVDLFTGAPASTDYDYNLTPGHVFIESNREKTAVIPNKIIAARVDNEGAVVQFIGTAADDATSQGQVGVVLELILDDAIDTVSKGSSRASGRLTRYQHEAYQGEVIVPINIGQEPWDWIGVTDTRLSVTYTGRVGRIIREYDWSSSSYRSQISLGIMRSAPIGGLSPVLTPIDKLLQKLSPGKVDVVALLEGVDFLERSSAEIGFFTPDAIARRTSGLRDPLRSFLRGAGAEPPDIPLARGDVPVGVPFWHGLALNTGNYQQVSQRLQKNTRGLAEDFPRFKTIFLRDFLNGGFAPVQIYQDGAGKLIIDGKTATGTDLTAIQIDMDLVPATNGLLDLGAFSPDRFWANAWVDVVTASLLIPKVIGLSDVGNVTNFWDRGYFNQLFTNTLNVRTGTSIDVGADLIPTTSLTRDLGLITRVWAEIWANDLKVRELTPRGVNRITVNVPSGVEGEGFDFDNSDVAHGMTAEVPTSVGGRVGLTDAHGGLSLEGYGETTHAVSLLGAVTANDLTKSTSAVGAFEFRGGLRNGTTLSRMNVNSNILVVRDLIVTRFILDSDGDSHQDVGTAWTNFDSLDDPVMLRDLAMAVTRQDDPLKEEFGKFLKYNQEQLVQAGLVTFNADGHHFVNMSRLTMLHTGAIWQLNTKIEALEQKLKMLTEGKSG